MPLEGQSVSDREATKELGLELLAHLEDEELSLAETVDRLEAVTTSPSLTREILDDAEKQVFNVDREWDADSVVGYLLSLSFCSPAALGEDREAFERDVRAALDAFEEPYEEDAAVRVVAGAR